MFGFSFHLDLRSFVSIRVRRDSSRLEAQKAQVHALLPWDAVQGGVHTNACSDGPSTTDGLIVPKGVPLRKETKLFWGRKEAVLFLVLAGDFIAAANPRKYVFFRNNTKTYFLEKQRGIRNVGVDHTR